MTSARADHRPSQRVRAEHGLREQVVDELLRRVLVHGDLLEDDVALLVELAEAGREDHVRHHLDRGVDVPVRDARVDDGVLPRGGGVQLRPHRVEGLGDLLRVVRARPLEQEVLDEVGDAGAVVPLVAGARADPEADRDGADARHPLGDDALARIELGEDVLLHRAIVPAASGCQMVTGSTPCNDRNGVRELRLRGRNHGGRGHREEVEMRRLSWRQALAYALGLMTATAGFAVGAAWAGHAATGGSVQACVNRLLGSLYLQNTISGKQPCLRGDATIEWAVTGPQGDPGPAGVDGARDQPGRPARSTAHAARTGSTPSRSRTRASCSRVRGAPSRSTGTERR